MATSGDQDTSSSEPEVPDHICTSCYTDGTQVTAVGYCVNCKEYLCPRCYDGHLIPSVTRKHVLIAREKLPGALTDDENATFSSTCPEHRGETIHYHCPSHSFFGCHFCFYKHQKTCKDVKCIQDVCTDLPSTEEYKEFTNKLTTIAKECKKITVKFKRKLETIKSSHANTVSDIQEFKREIVEEIEKIANGLVDKANRVKEVDLQKAGDVVHKCDQVLNKIQETTAMISQLQKPEHNPDLYIAMVKSRDKLKTMDEELQSVTARNCTRHVLFNANRNLKKTFGKDLSLGRVVYSTEKFEHAFDIDIKSTTDTTACLPYRSTLCSDKLVLTDYANRSVKLVDISNKKILSELKLSSSPFGVCEISDGFVAVAEQTKVVFVRLEPSLCIEREFALVATNHGICYCNNNLVVSYQYPPKIDVFDLQGNTLRTFATDDKGQPLFRCPYSVTTNPETSLIYVSDYNFSSVLCMKLDGTVVSKYTDSELRQPSQVITDSRGMVYVVGECSHNIHQLTADCKKVKVLLTSADGMNWPESIAYDQVQNKLYIGLWNNTQLKVYNVIYEDV